MKIFGREKIIPIDLGGKSMIEIMNYFPTREKVGSEEFYLKEVFHPNHIQIDVNRSRNTYAIIHDFEYDSIKNNTSVSFWYFF